MLTMHSTICLIGMKYLRATSGAKTSVLSVYIWGQLESFFTEALIKQDACNCHMLVLYDHFSKITTSRLGYPWCNLKYQNYHQLPNIHSPVHSAKN